MRKIEENKVMQLISPRKVQHWAKTYKDRYARLEKKGLIENAGKESVLKSKKNGSWNFMDDVDALIKQMYKVVNSYLHYKNIAENLKKEIELKYERTKYHEILLNEYKKLLSLKAN